jgi:hypothetical protein
VETAAAAVAAAQEAETARPDCFRQQDLMGRRRGSGPGEMRASIKAHDGILPRQLMHDVEQRRLASTIRNTIRSKATIPDVWKGCGPLETEWFRQKDQMGKQRGPAEVRVFIEAHDGVSCTT